MIRALLLALALCSIAGAAQADPVTAVASILTAGFTQSVAATIASFVINTALYTAASWALNKAFGPKIPGQAAQERQASILQLSIGEVPRQALFGEAATGGSLLGAFNYGGDYGTDWVVKVIGIADHRCAQLTGFYVNDTFVAFGGSGVVPGYNNQLVVHWRDGSAGQTFPADLLEAWQNSPLHAEDAPSSADIYRGMAYVVVAYKADAPDAEAPVWVGHPQMLFVVKGVRCYDPRKDSTVGGEGAHRWTDPATWEWTRNAAVCRYNWVRGIYALDQVDDPAMLLVGRGLSAVEAPPQRVFAYANLCDELVDDGAGGTEPRYLVDGVVFATQTYVEVEEMFSAAMAGQIIQPEGGVEVEPGQAKTPVFQITDDDLLAGQPLEFNEFLSDAERVNTVIPRYVEPDQKYQDHAAPVQRDEADLIVDGGPREETLALQLVTRASQAQRVGQIRRRRARLERRARIPVGPRFAEAEEGDWIEWTSARHTKGQPVVFLITAVSQDQGWGCVWTLEEISFEAFGFGGAPLPSSGGQTPTPPPGALALSGVTAQAIEIEGESGALVPAIRMAWDTPVDPAVNRIRAEVRRAGSSDTTPTVTEAVNAGAMVLTNGVAANALLEARLVPLGGPGRPVVPSNWIAVATGDLIATDVTSVGGRTVADVLAAADAAVAQGRAASKAAMELFLRTMEERAEMVVSTRHQGGMVKRLVVDETESFEDGPWSIVRRLNLVGVVTDNGSAFQFSETTLKASPTETWGQYRTAVATTLADNTAAIINEQTARTTADSAFASSLSVVSTTVDGHTASITTLQTSIDGISAEYLLVVDAGTNRASIQAYAGGSLSSIIFTAGAIGFTNGVSDVFPFAVVGSEVHATILRVGGVFAGAIVAESVAANNIVESVIAAMPGTLVLPNGSEVSAVATPVYVERGRVVVKTLLNISNAGGESTAIVKVLRDGAQIDAYVEFCDGAWGNNFHTYEVRDAPSIGWHTYEIRIERNYAGGGPLTATRALLTIELRKTET